VPDEPAADSNIGKAPLKKKTERKSRLQAIQDKGKEPDLPDVDVGFYLINYLFDIGPVMPAGMGVDRISQSEIRAWQVNTGIELRPWEVRALRRLSGEYAAEAQRATEHDCPSPLKVKLTIDHWKEVDRRMEAFFQTYIQTGDSPRGN
jgi:hypothetical protein